MADLGQDETAEPEPSDRDLTEDGTGRLGLAFNNPYLQRVCVDTALSIMYVPFADVKKYTRTRLMR